MKIPEEQPSLQSMKGFEDEGCVGGENEPAMGDKSWSDVESDSLSLGRNEVRKYCVEMDWKS